MIEKHRKLIPDVPIDHITKQGIYANFVKCGSSEQAKKTFNREPYYMTAARKWKETYEMNGKEDIHE